MDTFFHVMGVACLAAIAGIAAKIFAEAAGEYAKIRAALRGTNISPAASGAPHAPAPLPQLRRVEAAAEPAIQVCA